MRGVGVFAATCSGAMYIGVPSAEPGAVSPFPLSPTRASPKSVTLVSPDAVIRRLAGFKSR